MIWFTGSGIDLVEACPASAVLPHVDTPAGEAAATGSAIHSYFETGVVPAGFESDCSGLDLGVAVPPSEGFDLREATYCWCPETGQVLYLGEGLGRDYSKCPDGWVPVTLDRVFLKDGRPHVEDYKTGMEAPSEDTMQLGFGALCVSRVMGATEVSVSIVHVWKNKRIVRIPPEPKVLDSLDLAIIARRMQRIVAAIKVEEAVVLSGRAPSVRTGPQCEYCTASGSCPAYSGLIRRMLTAEDMVDAIEFLPDEKIPDAYIQINKASSLVEKLEKAIKLRLKAAGGTIKHSSGQTLKTVCVPRAYIIIDKAEPILLNGFGITPEVSRSVTLKAIREAAGDRAGEVEKALFEAGALGYKDTERVIFTKK